ncbi:hypothetical protein [Nitrososphaera sp.]|uniref:hypothetical protein n=1 Tax=Nitrososphaera sp. TaxID=1971748 RepID=UPI002ED8EC6F
MQRFEPLSQYLCSNCGSILKETDAQIDASSIVEDCPECGTSLRSCLTRRQPTAIRERALPPLKLQTAYDLTRFRLDIEKLSPLLSLATTGSLCISGYRSNLLLTRLCVRALLPTNHGGLDSPYVVIVDAGNKSDFYQTVDFIRQYGLNIRKALDRIIVSRTFTIYQLRSLLRELPKVAQRYQARAVVIPGLLDLFDDPNIKRKEAERVVGRISKSIAEISNRLLVITSLQDGKYTGLVTPSFRQRIEMRKARYGRVSAELYNQRERNHVSLTEDELKSIPEK